MKTTIAITAAALLAIASRNVCAAPEDPGAPSSASTAREAFSRAVDPNNLAINVALGRCGYGPAPDGMWYNRDREHTNRFTTNGCPQFGISGKVSPAFGWSIDWINLGWARTNAQAVACAGDDCSKTNQAQIQRAECSAGLKGDCLYNFRGAGGIKGLKIGATWSTPQWHGLSAELGAGILAYKSRWSVRVTPLDCAADDRTCAWTREIEQSTRCGLVCLSPEIEATLWYRNFGIGGQYYFRTTQHTNMTAGFAGPAHVWLIKARIPF